MGPAPRYSGSGPGDEDIMRHLAFIAIYKCPNLIATAIRITAPDEDTAKTKLNKLIDGTDCERLILDEGVANHLFKGHFLEAKELEKGKHTPWGTLIQS